MASPYLATATLTAFTLACWLLGLPFVGTPATVHAFGYEGIAQAVVSVDPPPLPHTLEELWQQTPIVARIRVLAPRPLRLSTGPGTRVVLRPYDCELLEVLRDSQQVLRNSQRIQVVQFGGTLREGNKVYKTTHGMKQLLDKDDELVVFLRPLDQATFAVAYGDASVLRLREGAAVDIPHGLRQLSAFAGQSSIDRTDLLNKLRALKGR